MWYQLWMFWNTFCSWSQRRDCPRCAQCSDIHRSRVGSRRIASGSPLLLACRYRVRLNVVGLSRGGIAAIFLANELRDVDGDQLSLALLLFDPVPGNLICSRIDWLCCCNTATQSLDLSSCTRNLKHVVALYPYEPLPDVAFHAPVLPCPPPPDNCLYDLDVTLGCHQGDRLDELICADTSDCLGALRWPPNDLASRLSFNRIFDFLHQNGTAIELGESHRS